MDNFREIKSAVLRAGAMTDELVGRVREAVYADGAIEKAGAEFLFELNETVREKRNTPLWRDLFVEAICAFLLEDEESPGVIDDNEAKWLRAHIQHDRVFDNNERALLKALRSRAIEYPDILNVKSRSALVFEAGLFGMRFVTFLAVLGSIAASIILFISSTIQIVNGLRHFFEHISAITGEVSEHLLATFVSSVDGYLFAMVLLIFGMGIYELFITKIDVVGKIGDSRPNWLKVDSIDDLKSSLGKVILMILIVSFFKYSIDLKYESVQDLLFLGIGIILVSGALYITHLGGGKHKQQ